MKVEIPKQIIAKLNAIQGAQAILLTGSRSVGKPNKNSDWDFCVILKKKDKRWRKTIKIGNTWLELFCNNPDDIKKELEEDLKEGRGVTTTIFATGIIIKDTPKKILRSLTEQAKKNFLRGPHPLSNEDTRWISYSISCYVQDIDDCLQADNDPGLLINQATNEIIRYYYQLQRVWLPRIKDRLIDIKKRDKALFKLVHGALNTKSWKQRAESTRRLGQYVGRKFKLNLDGQLYIPPKTRI